MGAPSYALQRDCPGMDVCSGEANEPFRPAETIRSSSSVHSISDHYISAGYPRTELHLVLDSGI